MPHPIFAWKFGSWLAMLVERYGYLLLPVYFITMAVIVTIMLIKEYAL